MYFFSTCTHPYCPVYYKHLTHTNINNHNTHTHFAHSHNHTITNTHIHVYSYIYSNNLSYYFIKQKFKRFLFTPIN